MPCDIEGLMRKMQIKQLTLECKDTKAQDLGLPPYHQASQWATSSNAIATNTNWNEPSSSGEEFPLETAILEIRAMRKGTCNRAKLASTLHLLQQISNKEQELRQALRQCIA